MKFIRTLLLCLAICMIGTGCSTIAPGYTPSIENVQKLKDTGNRPIQVGKFGTATELEKKPTLSLRGTAMASPYGGSYASYVAEAIKSELTLAQRYSANADLEISGELLKNDIDIAGFSNGATTIEVRFVAKDKGQIRFDQVKSIKYEFPSHFMGAIAIPNGTLSYGEAVKKLLNELYSDKAFSDISK